MKKILSILLMLSMTFSLVACSTEPASDVVDNDNTEVSGEVSEEVSDNEDEVRNVSLDELEEHELEFIDFLINTDWQSYSYTEDHENWIDNFAISINFNEDFTLIYTDEDDVGEGEWSYDGYDDEHENYSVKFSINGEEFYCFAGLDNEVYIYIESYERDFAAEFGVDNFEKHSEVLAGSIYVSTENAHLDSATQEIYEFFEDGIIMRQVNGTWEDGTWKSSSGSDGDIFISMTFGNELVSTVYHQNEPDRIYIDDNFYLQPYKLSDTIWRLDSINFPDGYYLTEGFRSARNEREYEDAVKMFELTLKFSSGTSGEYVQGSLNEGVFTTTYKADTFTIDTDISNINIYDTRYLYGTQDTDFTITSDIFSAYNTDGRNTAVASLKREATGFSGTLENPRAEKSYSAILTVKTDTQEFKYRYPAVYD